MQTRELESVYELGDVYDTIDACDELEMHLGKLKRMHVLGQEEWEHTRSELEAIRSQVSTHLSDAALLPKGPRLT
jgi:hypothetical protein